MIPNSRLWSFVVRNIFALLEKPCHNKTFYKFFSEQKHHCLQLVSNTCLVFLLDCGIKKKMYKILPEKSASLFAVANM